MLAKLIHDRCSNERGKPGWYAENQDSRRKCKWWFMVDNERSSQISKGIRPIMREVTRRRQSERRRDSNVWQDRPSYTREWELSEGRLPDLHVADIRSGEDCNFKKRNWASFL